MYVTVAKFFLLQIMDKKTMTTCNNLLFSVCFIGTECYYLFGPLHQARAAPANLFPKRELIFHGMQLA